MSEPVPLLAAPKPCICCGAVRPTPHRAPLCDACVDPSEIRSYCAKCGDRGRYPTEDFVRVLKEHYPDQEFAPGMAVRLPACKSCKDDGRPPLDGGVIRFLGISYD